MRQRYIKIGKTVHLLQWWGFFKETSFWRFNRFSRGWYLSAGPVTVMRLMDEGT